jgi:hypothetical protein
VLEDVVHPKISMAEGVESFNFASLARKVWENSGRIKLANYDATQADNKKYADAINPKRIEDLPVRMEQDPTLWDPWQGPKALEPRPSARTSPEERR